MSNVRIASPEDVSEFASDLMHEALKLQVRYGIGTDDVARTLHEMASAADEAVAGLAKEGIANGMRLQETSRMDRTQDKASQ